MTMPSATQTSYRLTLEESGPAQRGNRADEVVIGLSPGFGSTFHKTIIDLPLANVLREVLAGIEEQGAAARVVKAWHTSDLATIAHAAARLSGSGIGIGILSRGTTMIHQRDLPRLSSLELFPQSPLMTAEVFRNVGRNAAQYAKGESPQPVPTLNDQMARPRWQAKAALLHLVETEQIDKAVRRPVEVKVTIDREAGS